MQPKCKLCGSRTWRLIRELKSGKDTLFMYQCSNNHVHLLDEAIKDTLNPLEFVG